MQKERRGKHFPSIFHVILFGLLMVIAMPCKAQVDSLAVSSDSLLLKSALLQLESQTGYQIFFIDSWLEGKPAPKNGFVADLEVALEKLLADTDLNFYVLEDEKRVILLQNTIIYDELPKFFFGRPDSLTTGDIEEVTDNRPPPAFFVGNTRRSSRQYPLARIGKADNNDLRPSYTLKGRVTNERTGEPVPDLAIRRLGSNSVTVTDENGNYTIELPSGYNVISAMAMGIEDMEREIMMYNDGTLDLAMEEGLQQLEEVTVEADAISNVEETSTGTETIDLEESKNIPLVLGERDLLQVAKALPGISSAGEGATGLNVRGGRPDQNLVLLDDAVIYNPNTLFWHFPSIKSIYDRGGRYL